MPSKARLKKFKICDRCGGGIKNKELGLWRRHGLLANVSVGVSIQLNALVAGNGSYILRPCGHDLHSLTSPFLH